MGYLGLKGKKKALPTGVQGFPQALMFREGYMQL
jgi:hypothetical protein